MRFEKISRDMINGLHESIFTCSRRGARIIKFIEVAAGNDTGAVRISMERSKKGRSFFERSAPGVVIGVPSNQSH